MTTQLRTLPLLLLLALPFACRSTAQADASLLPKSHVHVVRSDGQVKKVTVELAFDDRTRAKGLMHRKEMAEFDGMLFVFDEDRPQTFWMKNTLIPLDMLFIKTDGTIAGIVESARPLDESPRGVRTPTRYVLELNGGWCAKYGIRTGDRVELVEALNATEQARTNQTQQPQPMTR